MQLRSFFHTLQVRPFPLKKLVAKPSGRPGSHSSQASLLRSCTRPGCRPLLSHSGQKRTAMEDLGTWAQESSTMSSLWAAVPLCVNYREFGGPPVSNRGLRDPQSEAPLDFHCSRRSPEFASFPACLTSSCSNTTFSKKPPISPRARDGSCGQEEQPARPPLPSPHEMSPRTCPGWRRCLEQPELSEGWLQGAGEPRNLCRALPAPACLSGSPESLAGNPESLASITWDK